MSEKRRVMRLKLTSPLNVQISSMGSGIRYDLHTQDLSTNGFFLSFEKPRRFPFNSSSILDVWLKLPKYALPFQGKIVRVVYKEDPLSQFSGPGLAIRIVSIEPNIQQELNTFLQKTLDNGYGKPSVPWQDGEEVPPEA